MKLNIEINVDDINKSIYFLSNMDYKDKQIILSIIIQNYI